MARIRSLKPDIWASAQVMNLSLPARLLFIGLITQADDAGRGNADTRSVRAAIFPGDDLPIAEIEAHLHELSGQGLVKLYAADTGARLYFLPTWKRHQRIDKPQASRYPAPDGDGDRPFQEHSENAPRPIQEGSRLRGEEGIGETGTGGSDRARPELTPDRKAMAAEIAPTADAHREWEAFLDNRASAGREGRDLDAGWRSWLRKVPAFGPHGQRRASRSPGGVEGSRWDPLRTRARAVGIEWRHPESYEQFAARISEAERAAQQSPAA